MSGEQRADLFYEDHRDDDRDSFKRPLIIRDHERF